MKVFFFVAAVLLYYAVHKIATEDDEYFFKIYYHTEYQNPTMSGSILAPTSQFCASVVLLLLMYVTNKLEVGLASTGIRIIPNFIVEKVETRCANSMVFS
jgi:hypothetical protein